MSSILLDMECRMGGSIVLNAIVREYCKRYDRVGIFCVPGSRNSIAFMYRDLTNLQLEMARDDRAVEQFKRMHWLHLTERHYDSIKRIWDEAEAGISPDRQVYAQADVPFEKRWSAWHIDRDAEAEQRLFKKAVPQEPYQFVHEDTKYESMLDPKLFNPTLPIVRADRAMADNIFDYCLVIERAREIHVVDSAYMHLVDHLPYSNPGQKLYVHDYARPLPLWKKQVLKKDWTFVV